MTEDAMIGDLEFAGKVIKKHEELEKQYEKIESVKVILGHLLSKILSDKYTTIDIGMEIPYNNEFIKVTYMITNPNVSFTVYKKRFGFKWYRDADSHDMVFALIYLCERYIESNLDDDITKYENIMNDLHDYIHVSLTPEDPDLVNDNSDVIV